MLPSFFKAMDISSSGLAAQRLRMNILSTNLANAQSTSGPGGTPYQRQDVVFTAAPTGNPFSDFLDESLGTQLKKVRVMDIHQDPRPPRMVYDPSHPHANKEGMVAMPNVDVVTEMVNMISATRSYEANTVAFNELKNMALKTIEIGR